MSVEDVAVKCAATQSEQGALQKFVRASRSRARLPNSVREMTRLIDVQRAYERTNTMMGNADDLRRDSLKRIAQAV